MNWLSPYVANSLWLAACWHESRRFHRDVHDVAATQERLLTTLLQRNAATEFGRRYDFASIRTAAEYQARVPLTSYDDYAEAIARISAGETNVLTRDRVTLLEPTSGSTAATKLIPYTAALQSEFQRALAAWIHDLFTHDPRLLGGQAYWSVTPVAQRAQRTSGGVPIGFEDDSAYLSAWQRGLAQSVLAVPALVKEIDEMEAFRYVTLLFLLRSRSLTLISVWNPTFLSLLVSHLPEWSTQLAEDIAQGTLRASLPRELADRLCALNQPNARRAREITVAFREAKTPAELHARLWPHLRLISCWTDAHAVPYAEQLARLFPQARVQGKGLLATEGFVSVPLHHHAGAALAVRSHFFEFIPAEGSRPLLAHELQPGERYGVVLTTGGGLYRYQLHDLVEVAGHYHQCPLLRFVGKAAQVTDWFGEKLNEQHVSQTLTAVLANLARPVTFTLLACETALQPPAYTLFIETAASAALLQTLAAELETALQENFHYRYCRTLGQLGTVRVFRIRGHAAETYLARCQAQGQRAGDIKPALLHRLDGWARAFEGVFIEPGPPAQVAKNSSPS